MEVSNENKKGELGCIMWEMMGIMKAEEKGLLGVNFIRRKVVEVFV